MEKKEISWINEIRDVFQDSNINFLIGSGLSTPYLTLLGNIENLLTKLSQTKTTEKTRQIVETSLYKKYFDDVISKNIEILENDASARPTLDNYKKLFQSINRLLLCRKSTILSKQINIFTTNVDIFLEKTMEELNLEYNDGFNGRFSPTFNLSNFKKSSFRKSLHYDNTSEIPVFNVLKLHGSLTWTLDTEKNIHFSPSLGYIKTIKKILIQKNSFINVKQKSNLKDLIQAADKHNPYRHKLISKFQNSYKQLLIVNPTQDKFRQTLFDEEYYEMLRIFSNELEKENTALFVMGFSFKDAHIRELTMRATDANPTLMVYIFAHTSKAKQEFEILLNVECAKNHNIKIISPSQIGSESKRKLKDEYTYNLENINNKIFGPLHNEIEEESHHEKSQP